MAYVKFELKDGSTVYIESADLPKGVSGLIPPEKSQDHAETAEAPFHKAIEAVSQMSAEMLEGLRGGFSESPSDLSISFGLKASADLGSLFISRSGMDANFNVSLSWHKESKSHSDVEAEKDQDSQEQKTEAAE